MAAIWATEGGAILHRVEHRDFQTLMKRSLGNAVLLVVSTQDLRALFATSLTGYLFQRGLNLSKKDAGA